ncbi:hypothetical protein MMPV_006584 [Pyropia vietnamensis]
MATPVAPSSASPAAFPIDTSAADARHPAHAARSTVAPVRGTPTAILVQPFADTVVVVVTQRGRLGTVWSASSATPSGLGRDGDPSARVVDVAALLGSSDDSDVAVLVRAVAGLLGGRSLLMTVALGAAVGADAVREVVAIVRQLLLQGGRGAAAVSGGEAI